MRKTTLLAAFILLNIVLYSCSETVQYRSDALEEFHLKKLKTGKTVLIPIIIKPDTIKIDTAASRLLHKKIRTALVNKSGINIDIQKGKTLGDLIEKKDLSQINKHTIFKAGRNAGIDYIIIYTLNRLKEIPSMERDKDFAVTKHYNYRLDCEILNCKNFLTVFKTSAALQGTEKTGEILPVFLTLFERISK